MTAKTVSIGYCARKEKTVFTMNIEDYAVGYCRWQQATIYHCHSKFFQLDTAHGSKPLFTMITCTSSYWI
jgi:hypothetical protein